ncbi:MAG: sigma-70 family RNA polymerase sigma factor [Clostridia bacterium]|nr:sigma-70 family RNA polymerase sigma factor [Clostridia bacterium]
MIGAEAVYREFHPKVSAYVRGKVAHPQDAEEIVSAVFLKVVQKLDSYDPQKAALSTWVYTITRNTVTDYYRTRHTAAALEDWMAGEEPSPEMSDDALDGLADALMALKERERDLIVLHYYRGHTLKTVAQMMGMSYINAKVIHKKALAGLRLAMGA